MRLLAARLVSFALASLFAATAAADVKLPALFTDHMVLQQGQKNRVWGWAEPGEEVTVAIGDQTQKAAAGNDGKWLVTLGAMEVGGPHTLSVSGKNKLQVQDVLIGEVWICSGQSNMGMTVSGSNDADLETRTANFPRIRLISVPQVGTQEPQDDFQGKWELCSPQTVGGFSAVGYFFGRQLHQTLDVPIGLIDDAWGGSAAEAWVRLDKLQADARYEPLLARWAETARTYNPEKAAADSEQQLAKWQEAVKTARAEGKPLPQRPRAPQNPLIGNQRPANIYNGVLKPTIGYGIRGVIWYQGESNASRAYQYRELFPLMVNSWREEWGQGDFPFYWVQLADFLPEKPEPGESAWAELREAQTLALNKLPNSGQAVIIDSGEANDIHPKDKQTVGKRLARWALARDYGITGVPYHSPQFKSVEIKEGKAIVSFDHVGGGLKSFDVNELKGFAVAGSDKKFVWAKAQVVGKDQIAVSAEGVAEPVAVRYAWADNPVCNIYSAEGLPVTPFRTDDWPGVTAGAN
jgi:sialate O-acetylesterase